MNSIDRSTHPYWTVSNLMYEPDNGHDGNHVSVEVVSDTFDFQSLAAEWDNLATASPTMTIFQTFDWQFLWWKHFGLRPENHLYIILFMVDGRLIGIAPFFIQSHSIFHFKIFRRLMLLGSGLRSPNSPMLSLERQGPSDFLDIIIAPGFEQRVSKSLIALLRRDSYLWDEMDLQNIPEKGVLFTQILPALEAEKLFVAKNVEDTCPVVHLPDSVDKYLMSLRTSVRRNLRSTKRAFLENKDYQVEDIAGEGNTDAGVKVLSQLHQKRWNAIGYPGLFWDKRFGSFIQDVTKVMKNTKKLWFKILRHDGKAMSANYGFRYNNRLYTYMSGFDREADTSSRSSGAGSALVLLGVMDSINWGFSELNTGRGTESYKSQLTSVASRNWRITVRSMKQDRTVMKSTLLRLLSIMNGMAMRMTCELSVMKIIAKDRGGLHAIDGYVSHLWHRLFRKETDAFSGNDPSDSESPAISENSKKNGTVKKNGKISREHLYKENIR